MSNSDNELNDYIKEVNTKLKKKDNGKLFFKYNPLILYIASFFIILISILIIRPKFIKKNNKLNYSRLVLLSLIIFIPVFFSIFLFISRK